MSDSPEKFAYPIDHWSYSSMMLFLRNRFMFKKQYILKLRDYKYSLAALAGRAAHKALQTYYEHGQDPDAAAKAGVEVIDRMKDDYIEWGKTGTREKLLEKYTRALNNYLAEIPVYHEILGIEKSLTSYIKEGGAEFALPLKSITDLIAKNKKGEIEMVDHKFIGKYTESETEKGELAFQAMFNYFNVRKEYGIAPTRMIFNECKVSANKDKSAQLQPYVIEFKKHPEYFDLFYRIYNDCTREISRPDCLYLPNFQDRFDAEQTFSDYKAQVIDVESPIVVKHKTGDFEFKEKKFVAAPVDLADNENLIDEEKIRMKLLEFGIPVKMLATYSGSSVIQYTLKPSRGVKMSTIESHSKDVQFALKSKTIRVQAPIIGTDTVGIEVPNPDRETLPLLPEHIESDTLSIPIGVNVYGELIRKDLDEMPHLLIAGATGSGKSVMINVIIQSLSKQLTPEQLNFVLIDPKRVELSQYRESEHVMAEPIYEIPAAIKALNWLAGLMDQRYKILESNKMKNIQEYNDGIKTMQYIVVVIDEFADLMLQDESAEKIIVRLAQKARAVGIHLILGTQRPSVDVVSGLIKANFPTRIAFMTSSRIDSQITLDSTGAEQLLGKGDMLFLDPHQRGLTRLQALYVR